MHRRDTTYQNLRSTTSNGKLDEHPVRLFKLILFHRLRELSLDLIHRTNNTNERQTSLVEAMRHVHNIFDDESMKTTAT